MPTVEMECERCGIWFKRYVRPGRSLVCFDCAMVKAAEHNLSMAEGYNPQLEASRKAGAETARQIRERQGPQYERWRRGMMASMGLESPAPS